MAQAKQTANSKAKSTTAHPVADKMKDTLHESVDTLSEKAAATEESLRETAHNSSQNIAAKHQEMQSKWNDSAVKKYATENPVATAGIAFAAGMLVSTFLRKK